MDQQHKPRTSTPAITAGRGEHEGDRSAVEVIALFDGAIVDARHFDDPAGGVTRKSTKLQLAGGGGAIGLALVLFLVAFVRGGGVALDLSAFFLIAGGVTALARGLAQRQEDRRPRDFTVGTGAGALLSVGAGAIADPIFPLLRSTGTGYELLVTDGLTGDLTAFGRTLPLGEAARVAEESHVVAGARAIPFVDGMRARVDVGGATVHFKSVAAPRRQPVPLRLDFASYRYTGAVFAAVSLFLLMIFAIPPDASALSLSGFDRASRFATILLKPEVIEEPKVPAWLKKPAPEVGAKGGKAHRGPTGKAGRKDAPVTSGKMAFKGPKDNVNLHITAKEHAAAMARDAGVIGLLRRSSMNAIFGKDTSILGNEAENAMGNLMGLQAGDSYGLEGAGLQGPGHGGGGNSDTTIGIGDRLDTIGGGSCRGKDCPDGVYGAGRHVAGLIGRKAHAPEVVPGQVVSVGGLDKEIIRRVIRRHVNEVKYCYDQALARQPDLYGRVIVKFAITPTGTVASSFPAESTVGSDVSMCVSQAVRRWEFPRPMGGGMVMVSYPFSFRAALVEQ